MLKQKYKSDNMLHEFKEWSFDDRCFDTHTAKARPTHSPFSPICDRHCENVYYLSHYHNPDEFNDTLYV